MKIAVLPNLDKKNSCDYTKKVIEKLNFFNVEIMMLEEVMKFFENNNITYCENMDKLINNCDIVITIGGDGTIIHASKYASKYKKPILGINLGRIGFVAELESDEIELLKNLVLENYKIEKRMMLELEIVNEKGLNKYHALNDIVVSRGALSRLIDLRVRYNDNKPYNYRADGLIVSTPTGSTAYSLSAGGPVIEPKMRCILLTPICQHSMFSRTVVFGEDAYLNIDANEDLRKDMNLFVTVDGEFEIKLEEDQSINIKVSDTEVDLIKLKNKSFYEVLNDKLP